MSVVKTLVEQAAGAVRPWHSPDAGDDPFSSLPQQSIDICLMCRHCADACDSCDGSGNVSKRGRPTKEIDTALLKEMLKLRRCNKEMCAALGVSERKLRELKNKV